MRWNELLADFDFKIKFRPGSQGGKPDVLTRIINDMPLNTNDECNKYQHQNLIKPQQILQRDSKYNLNLCPLEEPTLTSNSLNDWKKH